jgi:DNA-binding response OmpR family regulator
VHALIIEDQFLIASLIEDELRELDYISFDVVDREQEAVAAAERRCPDLITADDRLTNGSGIGPGEQSARTKGSPSSSLLATLTR